MPRIGLLPLYLALYDRALPQCRPPMQAYAERARQALEAAGLEVSPAPICTVQAEFDAAVGAFEREGVDLLVTLHLAYSPSGESAPRLAQSPLPILMLDTTPDFDFGPHTDPAIIMGNHGIHGLQDLASVLRRMGKRYVIEAGHLERSDVVARVATWAQAAAAARRLRTARVGRIGAEFKGMHDFAVEEPVLQSKLGPVVRRAAPAALAPYVPAADSPEVRAILEADRRQFDVSRVDEPTHVDAIRAGCALREFVSRERLSAVTMNFESFTADCGVPTVPFLGASRLMAEGVGYAGENDVLTAALVGALAGPWRDTTFTEMFCPDWKGGSVFLSHMGEINFRLAARRPVLVANPYPWAKITPPAIVACSPRPGPAVFVNLVPGPQDAFSLILAPVEVLPEPPDSRYAGHIRAWIKPRMPVEQFLPAYSRHGGTHHAALLLGDRLDDLRRFATLAGIPEVVIS